MPQFFSIVLLLLATTARADKIEFNRDVRPILSDKCFKCHGPDAKNQKSDFRLDTRESAVADLGDYAGIVAGDLKKSEVHWRIHSDDDADLMPPPESKMKLTAEEIAVIDRWIEEGAEYQEHWSFVPVPEDVPVPENNSEWIRNEIDVFVLAGLEREGFAPSAETSREKWIRRVTFDLTGLPPTTAAIDAFLADTSPEAFEKVVDRLFPTDAHAERLAAEWLDVARYSDSYGFQVDRDRTVWAWRDWAIRAFRDNLPYDEFVTWQLAGDLLPDPTRDQILATAFNRLHPQEAEGGSVPEEFRVEYVSDRLHTYGTAFLGLTMECARCHDHKYDPVTTKEYYELSSFFANIDEAGLYSFFTPAVPTPTLWLPTEDQEKTLTKVESDLAAAEKELNRMAENAGPAFERWLRENPGPLEVPPPTAAFSFDALEDGKLENDVPEGEPATTPANNRLVPGKSGQAIKLTGDDGVKLPVGNFARDDPFSVSLWMRTPDSKERAVVFSRSKAWTDAASRGYELLLEDGRLSFALIHFYPGNAIRVVAKEALPTDQWKHVAVSYDGSSRAAGVRLFVDGERVESEVVRDKLTREITGGGSDTIVIGERMRDSGFKDGLVDDFRVFDRQLAEGEIAAVAELSTATPDLDFYLANVDSAYREQFRKRADLRKQRTELVEEIAEIMVMEEKAEPRQSYLLDRGAYTDRGAPVSPETPEWLNPFPEAMPRNRLGLAKWTVDPANPLTARVAVNRYWQMLFGRGLVTTSEDFGSQGRPPSHPELLDWLARDFMDHGWDLRHLLKQIVLSATYRQSSDVESGDYAARDPENRLLYRYPAPRLSAEMIRDNALAVSGLLVEEVGGPSVKPYDIAVSFAPSEPGTGDDLYRRSLYTYWKRTAPAPLMTTLDASKRDVCRVRLERTDSPLQGLVLLNSPQFVEAARVLAEKLVAKHGGDDDAVIEDAFRRLTSRRPDSEERPILRRILSEQQEHFSDEPGEARKLVSIGDKPAPETDDPARLAAVATLVSTVMNFDECLAKR
ncbi:MAG: DUF1553 domain-containing protein [Verrucomicrobiales bacterium]